MFKLSIRGTGEGGSLEEIVTGLRSYYETLEGDSRLVQMAVLTRHQEFPERLMISHLIHAVLVDSAGLGQALSALAEFYVNSERSAGVVVCNDTWGFPEWVLDQMQAEADELATYQEKVDFLQAKLGQLPRPSDYPQEHRTEQSLYIAVGNKGEVVMATQRRGMSHELKILDPFEPDPFFGRAMDEVTDILRQIVALKDDA